MSDIFISHAVADKQLAALFTGFLKEAIGVPSDAIFCSSVPGHGIPLTEDFNAYMKERIQEPKLVFLLMTPSYMESWFCLMELGAAWAKSHRTLPIIVPPTSFEHVKRTLGLIQAWDIEDHGGLIELRSIGASASILLEKRTEHDWDGKRAEWRRSLKEAIPALAKARSVPSIEHDAVTARLAASLEHVADLERQLDAASDTIGRLEQAKDADAVRAIMRDRSGSQALKEEFEELLKDVQSALPQTTTAVRKHIIMDHYGKATRLDSSFDRADFDDAIQRNLIGENADEVRWDGPKLKKLRSALKAVDAFLEGPDGAEFSKTQDENVPMDADDREFWEHHVRL